MKLYPIIVSVEVQITDGDGTEGTARYMLPVQKLPSEGDMPKIIEQVMENVPAGFRLMTRHESIMHFLREEKGYHGPTIALPALDEGEEWHDPDTAHIMRFEDSDIDVDEE